MRREYEIENKELNLIIDCPFTKGDLTEHVSGATLINTDAFVSWIEEYNAYKFMQKSYNSDSDSVYYNVVNFPYTVPFTPDFTREFDIFPMTSTWGNIILIGHSISLEYGKSQPLYAVLNINNTSLTNYISPNNWHHVKENFDADNSTYEFWVDGTLKKSSALSQVTNERYSNNILRITCGPWANGSDGVSFLLKNLQYYLN